MRFGLSRSTARMASSISVAMSGARGLVLEVLPTGLRWHPEDPLGGVLVAVLQQAFELRAGDAVGLEFGLELDAPCLEGIGDVLQEEQAEDDVLVLGCVDLAAQGVCRLPKSLCPGEIGSNRVVVRHLVLNSMVIGGSWSRRKALPGTARLRTGTQLGPPS